MKTLIVYYSLEGNTEYAVNMIKEETGADVLKLVPVKAYHDKGFSKFLWGGKSAVMAEKPKLEEYSTDLSQYDQVVFGFPVWASTITPPIRTFVTDNKDALKGKHISAFACQSGNGAEKAFVKLSDVLGSELEKTAIFIDPKARKSDATDNLIMEFAKSLVLS